MHRLSTCDRVREKNKAAQELGRLGGLSTSAAKKRAVRENGKKGGRPRKKKNE
jgi:general stress protein YciG